MIRIAIVGLGKMGLSHLAIARTHPELEVAAVCDSFGILLKGLNRYAGLKTYSDYAEMLEREPLDAVLIATPSRFHGAMVRQALEKGLHVFCEKPFCLEPAEGRDLAVLADRKGVVNQVGYHYRFLGTFNTARSWLSANLIGKVHHVRAEAYGPVVLRTKNATWRAKKSEGGGCLFDYACHAVDLVNFIFDIPERVSGTTLNRIFSSDVDDEVYANLHFRDGASGQIATNWSDESFRKMSMQITLWGDNGRMRIDRQEIQIYLRDDIGLPYGLKKGWNTHFTTGLTDSPWFYLRGEEYSSQIDHFVQCIKNPSVKQASSFKSAVETDEVLAKMLLDAARVPGANDRELAPIAANGERPRKPGITRLLQAFSRS